MNINYENKTSCLGFLEYLLYSLPITEIEQVSLYISQLKKILILQEQCYSHNKLEQIFSFFSHLVLSNSVICMASVQLIQKRISELSEINADVIEEIVRYDSKFQAASEIIALELKNCLSKKYPEPAVLIPHSWFYERAQHFLVGVIHRDSPFVLDSVFDVPPDDFSDIEYKAIFSDVTDLYIKFRNTTGLPIPYLFDLDTDTRHLVLENVDELKTLTVLTFGQFIEYLRMDNAQLQALIQHIPILKKINMKLHCKLQECSNWSPEQLAHIEANLPLFEKIVSTRGTSMMEFLSLSSEDLVRVKNHLVVVNLFIKYQYSISTILLLSDQQLNFISSHQREFSRFFLHYAKSSAISQLSSGQIMLIPQYLMVGNLLEFTLEQILSYDHQKIQFVYDNFIFFANLDSSTTIHIQDFLNIDEETISQLIKIKSVFYRLYNNGMPIEKIIEHADSHLLILEKYKDSIYAWTNFNLEIIYLLLQMPVIDLEEFCEQFLIINQLISSRMLSFKENIAIPANERIDSLRLANLYTFFKKANPKLSFHDVLNLPQNIKKDLVSYNYQYYKMLLSGFELEDLCPRYRVFYLEMIDFCEHITTMKSLKALDEKRFFKVMFFANAFKEYIAKGHITFEKLTIYPPELLEELAKHCYHYHKILELSGITLDEFLTIDSVFRVKLAMHAGSFENILRNLKLYIRLSPELQSEIFEHRRAYGRLLLQSTVKLEQLINFPDLVRQQILQHATVFNDIIPSLTMPFEEFVLSRQHDLVEFSTLLAENQMNLFGYMQFNFDDLMRLSVDELRQLISHKDDYFLIARDFHCSIRDFYNLHPEQKNRLLKHQAEINEFMRNYHFTFNDILILDIRANGQFFENVNLVVEDINEDRLDREALLQMDNDELCESIISTFFKKPRLCFPSFI